MKKLNVKLPQGGSKRALHSGMYASALAVVVLAVIILVNLVIRALPTKIHRVRYFHDVAFHVK